MYRTAAGGGPETHVRAAPGAISAAGGPFAHRGRGPIARTVARRRILRPVATEEEPARRRGRPRREIDPDAVADVVERLFADGGIDAVSIERAAEELGVSRATLYRTVPSKEDLLAIPLERATKAMYAAAKAVLDDTARTPREHLIGLMHVQIDAAVTQRDYLFIMFGGGPLPPEAVERWRRWRRDYEKLWVQVVEELMAAGELDADDPKVATRLILGMSLWVARWYRPQEGMSADDIAEAAVRLVLPPR